MVTIKTYLYPNTVDVQIWDPTIFTTRNRVVYNRTIKIYQGIDNPLQVICKNQDQKAVDLTGSYLEAAIQDPVNQITVVKYDVNFTDIARGLGYFTIEKSVVASLEQRIYKLTFSVEDIASGSIKPIYIDDNYGVPLDLMVLPAYYADLAPSVGLNQSVIDAGNI